MGIHPYFTDCLSDAAADKMTIYGKTSVAWSVSEDELKLRVQIPEELTGKVFFPSSYTTIQNQMTGESYQADEEGCFHFNIPSGTWEFIAQKGGSYDD